VAPALLPHSANTCTNRGAGLQACGGRPRPPVPLREERVLEDPAQRHPDLEVRPTTFRSISRHREKYAALGTFGCRDRTSKEPLPQPEVLVGVKV
jgi:hypothetical protein